MRSEKTHGVSDPLAVAARIAFRAAPAGAAVKSVANALGVSLATVHNWFHHMRQVPPHLRAILAAAIDAEMDRQDAAERADARRACANEMKGGHASNVVQQQTADGHQEMDCAANGGRKSGAASNGGFA